MTKIFLLPLFALMSGCGVMNATEAIPGKMDAMKDEVAKTNDGMARTNAAIHNQTLAVAYSTMMSDQNTELLSPAPLGMMPAGQVFAKEATADDLIQMTYVLLTDINESTPDESLQDPTTKKFSDEVVRKIDHEKLAKLSAAMIINGLAPQATIDQIVSEQIDQGGQYEETAYQLLALRYVFVDNVLLANDLFKKPMNNLGKLTKAVERADILQSIAALPYASKLQFDVIGMLNAADNQSVTIDAGDAQAAWVKINSAFDNELDARYKDAKSADAGRTQVLRSRVKSHLPPTPIHPSVRRH